MTPGILARSAPESLPGPKSLLFTEVSVPPSHDAALAVVRVPGDGKTPESWTLVDLKTALPIDAAPTRDAATSLWRARGLPEPAFVTAADAADRFSETFSSRFDRYLWYGWVWGIFLAPALPVLAGVGVAMTLIVVWRARRRRA